MNIKDEVYSPPSCVYCLHSSCTASDHDIRSSNSLGFLNTYKDLSSSWTFIFLLVESEAFFEKQKKINEKSK